MISCNVFYGLNGSNIQRETNFLFQIFNAFELEIIGYIETIIELLIIICHCFHYFIMFKWTWVGKTTYLKIIIINLKLL